MKRTIQLFMLCLPFFLAVHVTAQAGDPDLALKETFYKKYKYEVRNYSHKDFGNLFLEFFQKTGDQGIVLSKDEYYTYTIKIAIYSEKQGLLYKDKKEEAQKTKQEWFSKNYDDYLNSRTVKSD